MTIAVYSSERTHHRVDCVGAEEAALDFSEGPAHRKEGNEAAIFLEPRNLTTREEIVRTDSAPLVVGYALAQVSVLVDVVAAEKRVVHLQ